MTAQSVTPTEENNSLPYLSKAERLDVYNLLTSGVQHLWSKNKIQDDRVDSILNILVPLAHKDPYFLAHLTSYIFRSASDNKDLKIMSAYANALSSADGTPFSEGSTYKKPDLRIVSAAAIQMLDPKQTLRLTSFEGRKWAVDGHLNYGRHFPNAIRTAIKKYIKYRESNPYILRGVTRVGLRDTMRKIYIKLHMAPSDEAASILRWQQKDHRVELAKREFDFTGLSDIDIAQKIQSAKIPFLAALGELARVQTKISPVIAVALLEQATGDQAIIARNIFDEAGILKDKEVASLYEKKIREAKNALDRVQAFSAKLNTESAAVLKKARADVRKEQIGNIGKVYMHIDASQSMDRSIDFAKEQGAVLAELVKSPEQNFRWGMYNDRAMPLELPAEFVADAFKQVLFGRIADGSTDCFALYPTAREFGADVDIQITDGGHNGGDLRARIRDYHTKTGLPKPKVCVLVDFADPRLWSDVNGHKNPVKEAYEDNGIPVAVIKPESLNNSAGVSQAIKKALEGPLAVIDEIMGTELLKLPDWYYSL